MIIKQTKEKIVDGIENDKTLNKRQKQEKISYLEELEAVEEKYSGKLVKATLMQLAKADAKQPFDIEMKKVLRNNCLVEVSEFVRTNWNYKDSGRLYVLDVEATEKQNEAHKAWKEEVKAKQDLENEVGVEVSNALKNIGQVAKQKVAKQK